jgi:hypothetical protein
MRGIEALIALRQLKKVKRKDWRDGEYLATFVTPDGCRIAPSPKYNQYRGENCFYPEDAVLLTDDILDDFLMDDWEIVE